MMSEFDMMLRRVKLAGLEVRLCQYGYFAFRSHATTYHSQSLVSKHRSLSNEARLEGLQTYEMRTTFE